MSATDYARAVVPATQGPLAPPAAAGGVAAPSGAGVGAGDVWRIIKQRKLLIMITFCLLYMVVVGGTIAIWKLAPTYTSTASVRFVPPAETWTGLEDAIVPKEYIDQQLATEAANMRSNETLLDLLAQPEIQATDYYKWYKGDHDECLYEMQKALGIAPVRDSYLIRVSLPTRKPSEATLIVNTLIDRYVERSRSLLTDERRVKLEVLRNTRDDVNRQLEDVRRAIRDLRRQQDMPAIESKREVLVQTVAMLGNTKAELMAREADIQAQLDTIRGVDPRNLPLSAEMKLIIESDPMLRYYQQQVEQLDIQISVSRKNLMGDNHRQMKVLLDQRNGYFQKEAARREQLVDDLRSRQVESLEQERARIRRMLAEVQEQLWENENQQRDLDAAIQRFLELEKDEVRLGRELEQVALAVREAEHQDAVKQQQGRLVRAGRARDAVLPSRPNFVIYLGGGFVLSLLLAAGLAFLREFTDQALRTPIDVARYGRMSVLGCVPLLDDEEADVDEMEMAARRAPQSLVAEAFRQIRAHLMFSGPPESQQVLLITSPGPEDGKTATAINLAVTFARGNQRVLLIDGNFRRPAIREAFSGARAEGLSNVLAGHSTLEEVVSRAEFDSLDVLTSGPMPPNPAELLGSQQMRNLIDAAKKSYDRIILDGPPCLVISDALVLGTQVDAVVVVARAATSTKGALRRAREQFQRINARVVGAILNGVQARAGGYFRERYREFYEYTSEEVVPRELPGGPPEITAGDNPGPDNTDSPST